jgi:hypothetical protein
MCHDPETNTFSDTNVKRLPYSGTKNNKVVITHCLSAWLLSVDWSEGRLEGTKTKSSVSSGLELLPWPLTETGDPAKMRKPFQI